MAKKRSRHLGLCIVAGILLGLGTSLMWVLSGGRGIGPDLVFALCVVLGVVVGLLPARQPPSEIGA